MIPLHVFFKRMSTTEQKSDSSFCDFILTNQIKKEKEFPDGAVSRCFSKQVFLKISQYLQSVILRILYYSLLQPVTLLKRDSNTVVFL